MIEEIGKLNQKKHEINQMILRYKKQPTVGEAVASGDPLDMQAATNWPQLKSALIGEIRHIDELISEVRAQERTREHNERSRDNPGVIVS